jgi:hypothetical protein
MQLCGARFVLHDAKEQLNLHVYLAT